MLIALVISILKGFRLWFIVFIKDFVIPLDPFSLSTESVDLVTCWRGSLHPSFWWFFSLHHLSIRRSLSSDWILNIPFPNWSFYISSLGVVLQCDQSVGSTITNHTSSETTPPWLTHLFWDILHFFQDCFSFERLVSDPFSQSTGFGTRFHLHCWIS